VARHPERPHFLNYVEGLVQDFAPLAGDRLFGEDQAILGGIGRLRGRSIMIIGHEKGSDTEGRIKHNFGMARPEGYRKAQRLMDMADRFSLPVVSLVDTAGAYPGVGAEERGQAEAIARCTDCCLGLGVPIISVIIGEGGSGGAVAIATANRLYMLEHAIYTVASPEAAASILWRDSSRAVDAATNMKITAQDLAKLGVIDGIIPEPIGGAHRDGQEVVQATGNMIGEALAEFDDMPPEAIRKARREKFMAMGRVA
jgi:acetyl-CoA carboxylase carboxyl transferase subunit alpha